MLHVIWRYNPYYQYPTAFFLAAKNKAFTLSAPSAARSTWMHFSCTNIHAAEACSGVSNVPIWRVLPPHLVLDANLPGDFL